MEEIVKWIAAIILACIALYLIGNYPIQMIIVMIVGLISFIIKVVLLD